MSVKYVEAARNKLKFDFPYDIKTWVNDMDMMMENYHRHSCWSNFVQIDSATSTSDFMNLENKLGCKLHFSTEHGYQGEWIKVYNDCVNNGLLKFRYGVEVYWVKDTSAIIQEEYEDKNGDVKIREKKDDTNCHMVIIARTYNAIRKMNYLISCAHTDGFYRKPRIDLNQLFEFTPEEIYVTSACIAGWKYENAAEIWFRVWNHFKDSFFLEYQANNTEEQKKINKIILSLHQSYGIQTIAGLDTHYLNEEDRIKRENLLQRKGISYPEEEGWYMDFPSGKEFYKRMIDQGVVPPVDIIYSMMNTHVFVEGCEDVYLSNDFKIPILPNYIDKTYEERCEALKDLLFDQYEKENETHKTLDRREAITYEWEQYCGSGTADYALSNNGLVKLAVEKYNGQLTTTSRGSASSFYTSKLLGFTTMDRFESEVPIFPERFITKERVLASHQMPDIDLNCAEQEPFVKAARELFGENGCYPLLAVGTLGEKSGFKLYADIQGIEPSIANDISKSIDKYNEALKQVDDENDRENIRIEDYITDPHHLRVFNESKPYQGIVEQAKCHACGFMIFNGDHKNHNIPGYGDIRYEIGLIRCVAKSGKSTIVANIEGNLLDSFGYVKDDFLIVDVVGIIYKLYHALGENVPTVSELRRMVTNDTETWETYSKGITCCLNQCEKTSTTKKVMEYKPQNIKELAAFIAGIRPGFKSHIDNFIHRNHYSSGEPAIDKLLTDSFNYMLYQESVMGIFSYLGIPMKDAYDTIKKISKKKLKGEALKHVEDTLSSHWKSNIGNLDNFDPVYKVIKDSARYSFNAPHALAMACDSLYEAWMKAHYTSTFYEVTLNHYQNKGDKNKVAELLNEAVTCFGYQVGHYEYGKDNSKFTIDDKEKIIYPDMASIKGIGRNTVEDMMALYDRGFRSITDIYLNIKGTHINSTVLRDMVKIGYFQKIGSVKQILRQMDIIDQWRSSSGEKRKTISKDKIPDEMKRMDISLFATDVLQSGKISDKQYKITNWRKMIDMLCSEVPGDEFPSFILGKLQYDVLGYVDRKDPTLDKRYIVVTALDTTYSPKFKAYCIATGQTVELKVHKSRNPKDKTVRVSFRDEPFADGDILYMKKPTKKPKVTKVGDKWVESSTEVVWWLDDYEKVDL